MGYRGWMAGLATGLVLLAGCTSTDQATESDMPVISPLRALGQEPPWLLELDAAGTELTLEYGARVLQGDAPEQAHSEEGQRFISMSEVGPIEVHQQEEICVDTMSGMSFPARVEVQVDGQVLRGCGGESSRLLTGRQWLPVTLDEQQLRGQRPLSLSFTETQQLAGQAPCNRFGGSYELTGEGLRLMGLYSTRMACEPSVMEQEILFLAALEAVVRFEMDGPDRLELVTADGSRLRAEAAPR